MQIRVGVTGTFRISAVPLVLFNRWLSGVSMMQGIAVIRVVVFDFTTLRNNTWIITRRIIDWVDHEGKECGDRTGSYRRIMIVSLN